MISGDQSFETSQMFWELQNPHLREGMRPTNWENQ